MGTFDEEATLNNILGRLSTVESILESMGKRNTEADQASDIVDNIGDMDYSREDDEGNEVLSLRRDGMALLNPDVIDIHFWASIGVASNVFTYIHGTLIIGTKLYVTGAFTKIGSVAANNIACYDLVTGVWSALSTGLDAVGYCLETDGINLYVGGNFTSAGGVANTAYLAKWNGSAFSALSTGLNAYCLDMVFIGADLYLTGNFTLAGGVSVNRIAKWNGTAFSALSTGLNSVGYCLATDGTDLYIGGSFTLAGGVANTAYIAKWNGSAFSALGTGLNNICRALLFIGTDLYLGGDFTLAGGVADTLKIAKWDGSAYSPLSTGLTGGSCRCLAAIGGDLYLGGSFTQAGGVDNTLRIAKWEETSVFRALGSGLDGECSTLSVYGTDLYMGGGFANAGGRASKGVAAYLQTLQSALAYLEISGQAIQDALLTGNVTLDGNKTLTGTLTISAAALMALAGINVTNGFVRSYSITLADDVASSFTPIAQTGGIFLITSGGSNDYVMTFYNTTGPVMSASGLVGTNAVVTTGPLTNGTGDGTDTKFNVSCDTDGKIYLKNRRGAVRTVFVLLI